MRRNQAPRNWWRHPAGLLACGLGAGAAPYAPGTVGTLAAVPLFLVLHPMSLPAYGAVVVVLFALGVWCCEVASRSFGVHDHSAIVIDEIVGYLIVMLGVAPRWHWMAVGFVLFRVADIIKPWPACWADRRVAGGFGIMLDDVLAAAYAWAGLQLLIVATG